MIGDRVYVTMRRGRSAWFGTVRLCALWLWPVSTYACCRPTEEACLQDVFNVVSSMLKEPNA